MAKCMLALEAGRVTETLAAPTTTQMSHVPLLAKHAPPRLQSPHRGPQVFCLCLLFGIILLVSQTPMCTYVYNATHTVDATTLPPPAAVHRLLHDATDIEWEEMSGTMQDLIVTVRFLAQRALTPR